MSQQWLVDPRDSNKLVSGDYSIKRIPVNSKWRYLALYREHGLLTVWSAEQAKVICGDHRRGELRRG